MAEMDCPELVERITDYLEGALAPPDRAGFDAHLAICDPCTEYVEQFRRTIAVSGRIDPDGLSATTREGLLRAFRGDR